MNQIEIIKTFMLISRWTPLVAMFFYTRFFNDFLSIGTSRTRVIKTTAFFLQTLLTLTFKALFLCFMAKTYRETTIRLIWNIVKHIQNKQFKLYNLYRKRLTGSNFLHLSTILNVLVKAFKNIRTSHIQAVYSREQANSSNCSLEKQAVTAVRLCMAAQRHML